jgi:hypothetical protein
LSAVGAVCIRANIIAGVSDLVTAMPASAVENGRVHSGIKHNFFRSQKCEEAKVTET